MMSKHECYARVGERIRTAREAAGMTRRELAKRIGVGETTIVSMEQGSAISFYSALAVSEVLDANLYDFADFSLLEAKEVA